MNPIDELITKIEKFKVLLEATFGKAVSAIDDNTFSKRRDNLKDEGVIVLRSYIPAGHEFCKRWAAGFTGSKIYGQIDSERKLIVEDLNVWLNLLEDVKKSSDFKKGASPVSGNPIVFVSYAGDELALADFLREILHRWTDSKIDVFVAKRDIPSGDNPLKIMMEDRLKRARAIIPICSIKSRASSWVWWESSAVWARGYKVYPLFTNITASDFGAPLTLVSQGKNYFIVEELLETLVTMCRDLGADITGTTFVQAEIDQVEKLKAEYSKAEISAKVLCDYKKLEMKQDFHKYSFIFEVENKTQRKFDDVIVELLFPIDYLERKEWEYPHLRSQAVSEKPGYLCLVFSYAGLNDKAKAMFLSGLLPGKKLRVFGEGGITNLVYEMDHDRWDKRFKYDVQWKVYINGNAPIDGSIPLNSIQYF